MRGNNLTARVLAIDPCSKGFGFAVLEAPDRLVDWGVACVWSGNSEAFLARVDAMIQRYSPTCIAIEAVPDSPRRARTVRHLRAIECYLRASSLPAAVIPAQQIRALVCHSRATKHDLALHIAKAFPELAPWCPPRRLPWKSEDARMHIFDAVALAITSFYFRDTPTVS